MNGDEVVVRPNIFESYAIYDNYGERFLFNHRNEESLGEMVEFLKKLTADQRWHYAKVLERITN